MPRRGLPKFPRLRDERSTAPADQAGLGSYITTDGEGARRKALPHWLSEAEVHPDAAASGSSVRVVREEDAVAAPEEAPEAVEVEIEEESEGGFVDFAEAEADDMATRVLGVNISGGSAYLAVIEPPGRIVPGVADRLVPARDLEGGDQLADFAEQVARTLGDLRIAAVAVARPLRYTDWRYTDAYARISLETCIVLEARRLSLRFESVGQHHAANVVGLPLPKASNALASRLGMDKTLDWLDWPNRFPAVLVGLAVALQART